MLTGSVVPNVTNDILGKSQFKIGFIIQSQLWAVFLATQEEFCFHWVNLTLNFLTNLKEAGWLP